jgi:hypothetical protein
LRWPEIRCLRGLFCLISEGFAYTKRRREDADFALRTGRREAVWEKFTTVIYLRIGNNPT